MHVCVYMYLCAHAFVCVYMCCACVCKYTCVYMCLRVYMFALWLCRFLQALFSLLEGRDVGEVPHMRGRAHLSSTCGGR